MKSITYEEFLSFKPCWINDADDAKWLEEIGRRQERWTALDILGLEEVSADDRLWVVLREELIGSKILHEFGCRCADRALSRIEKPDARSVAAPEAKRKWLRGEISDAELDAASDAARYTARYAASESASDAAWYAASDAASDAAWYAASDAARSAASDAAWYAAMSAAMYAAMSAAWYAASDVAMESEYIEQVSILKTMLVESVA